GFDARHERTAVTPDRRVHDPGARRFRDRLRAVHRTVVGHHDLADDTEARHAAQGLADADLDGLRLVEAGEHNADLDGLERGGHAASRGVITISSWADGAVAGAEIVAPP